MSKIINIKDERKKIDKKNLIMRTLFFIIILYIAYAVYLIIRTPTDTITVTTGTITVEESSTGYVIRDEVVVKGNNYKNGIYQIVSEGVRAAKNQTIFRYYGKSEDELQNKISEIDEKLQEAMEEEETSIYSSDAKALESQIDEKVESLNSETDIQAISELKKEVAEILIKKAKIIGELSKSGSYINKLIAQREKYEEQLISDSEYMVAPVSGVVSYKVDGLEEVLTTDDFESLTAESLEELDVKTGKVVATSDECAKVINNFECYLAIILNSDIAKEAQENDSVKITLSSGSEVSASIEYLKEQEDGRMLIIFKLSDLTDELISYRKLPLNITWWSYSGMKVPNDAILEEDGLKYVVQKTSSGTKKILVKVLKKNDQYSIISNYSSDDLNNLGLDSSEYTGIEVYDTILMYPE